MEDLSKYEGRIEIICSIEGIRFFKNEWGIIQVSVDKVISGVPYTNDYGELVLKGEMPQVKEGDIYHVVADFVNDPKWGGQYNILKIYSEFVFDNNDKESQKKFLCALFTPRQINILYDHFQDPFKLLMDSDIHELVKAKGIGMYTAMEMINKFKTNFYISKIFVELNEYDLTKNMIERLMKRYNSPDLIIAKVKENPYVLSDEVDGIGWVRADELARKGGIAEDDPRRIAAYIIKYLTDNGNIGRSYISTDELLGGILDNLGEHISDSKITEAICSIKDSLWYDDEKTNIGLKKYYDMELKVGEELLRLRNAAPLISENEWDNWLDVLRDLEKRQGWQFTEEQKNGIYLALSQNIVVITGMAGTGKSSLVTGILEVLKNYSFVQCALSGRAASRLSEVTGHEGYTIHRLLGYPSAREDAKQLFEYHDEHPLPYDIYILDEISMVNTTLFYDLIRAIPSGAKLICLGDHGQLEPIGEGNIAHDMISSPEIATVVLTKIHRQAEASGIISEALKIRKGVQIIDYDWVGTDVRGELKDFTLTCYSDASNSFYKIMAAYSTAMSEPGFDIMKTQIIVPMKSKGNVCTYELNNAVQELVNPSSQKKAEVTLFYDSRPYVLREGDKVINTRNNYRLDPVVYNGNIGIIKKIEEDFITVDFPGIGVVDYPNENGNWTCLDLAYAITCHKSQGSEFDTVIVGIDYSSYALLTQELIYTAITRAKKKCILIAQSGALRMATKNKGISKKCTHLKQILYDIAHPKLVF